MSRDRRPARPPRPPPPTLTSTSAATSGSAPATTTMPEEPDPEGSLVCQICFETYNGNWGLVHGRTMHAGYCEGCAEKLKRDRLPCPQCRSDIEAVIKVFMN